MIPPFCLVFHAARVADDREFAKIARNTVKRLFTSNHAGRRAVNASTTKTKAIAMINQTPRCDRAAGGTRWAQLAIAVTFGLIILAAYDAQAQTTDFVKDDNSLSLSTNGSYTTAGIPDSNDRIIWNSTAGNDGRTVSVGGTLTIGQVRVDNVTGAVQVTVAAGNNFGINGVGGTSIDMTTAAGDLTLTGGGTVSFGSNVAVNVAANRTLTLGTSQFVAINTFTKQGDGTFIINSDSTSNAGLLGTISVQGGTLRVGNNAALGSTDNGVTVASGANLELNAVTIGNEPLSIAGSGTGSSSGALRSISGANSFGGNITLSAAAQIQAASGSTLALGGTISGAHALDIGGSGNITVNGMVSTASLTKSGSGIVTLNNSNTYTGGTTVNAGTLKLGSGTTLANSGDVTVSGGTLDLNGFTETVQDVSLTSGSITGGTLNAASYDVQAGSISANLGNTAATLTKTGAGTVTLSGTNSYTGGTLVNQGTLQADSSGALPVGGAVSVAGGAILDLQGNTFNVGNVTLTSGTIEDGTLISTSTYNVDSGTVSANLQGNVGLNKNTAGTVTLSGTNTYTGTTTVNDGTLLVDGSIAGEVTVTSGATLGGSGTLNGAVTFESGSNLSPGNSPDIQTYAAGLELMTGSTFTWELFDNTNSLGDRGIEYDGVNVTGGTLEIESGVTSALVFNEAGSTVDWNDAFWNSNRQWLVFDNASPPSVVAGIFGTITVSNDSLGNALGAIRSGASFFWSTSNDSDDIFLNYNAAAVPEPGSLGLMALVAVAGGFAARRRSRKSKAADSAE